MQSAMAGGEQVFELLDTIPAVQDLPNAPDLPKIAGGLSWRMSRLPTNRTSTSCTT